MLARAGLLHHLTSPRCALDEPFVATAVCYDASTPAVPAAGIGGGGGADGCGRVCPTCPPASTACLLRPIVLQVSRWDKLKGFAPLLAAWVELKSGAWPAPATASAAQRAHYERLLETSVLVLAGPEPASICDDPEGKQVLEQLQRHIDALPPALRGDVKLALLPMADAQENALIVNALQRSATIVVQCSLQEGFGLTVTEALFKRVCVVGTQAVGLREQIRDRIDGLLVAGDPAVPANVARALQTVLLDSRLRAFLAVNGQRRVYDEGLLDMCQLGE